MSTITRSRYATSEPATAKSLADLMEGVASDKALSPRKRRDVSSALNAVAKALGRGLAELPADPRVLRQRLLDLTPAKAGVTTARWRNVISLLAFAFRHGGVDYMAGRSRDPLSPAWTALRLICPQISIWTGISRFGRWCTQRHIEPDDVTAITFDDFRSALIAGLFVKNPDVTHSITSKTWNLAAQRAPQWPAGRAILIDRRRTKILPWETYPHSLKDDFDAYMKQKSEGVKLQIGRSAPLRPTSLRTRTYQFRQYIAALVRVGHDPVCLKSVAAILAPDLTMAGLLDFLADKAPDNTRQAHGVATLLRSLALWSDAPENVLKPLREYCNVLQGEHVMTEKNKQRLRQMDDPKVLQDLLELPDRVFDRKNSTLTPCRRALEIETALMIAILLDVPFRVGNLVALDLDQHLSRFGKERCYRVSIPAHQVKNNKVLSFPLSPETSQLIDIYRERYRPLLLDVPTSALFPGRGGGAKSVRAASTNIPQMLRRECGIAFNVHAFRHLAAYMFLQANPGSYEIIRRLLGHKRLETTISSYCGLEDDAAFRHFADTIRRRRVELSLANPRGLRK